jgi:hypothetical protein
MKKIILTLLYFIINSITGIEVFAQINYSPVTINLPNGITLGQSKILPNVKRIEQYEQNILLNIEEYDTKGNLLFDYFKQEVGDFWNGKYIVMIKAQLFNQNNQLVKSYNIHSNAYLSIRHYEYDKAGNNSEVWVQEINDDTAEVNSNPYRFIFTLTDFKSVLKNPIIKEVESNSRKYLLWKNSFDVNNNLIKQVEYTPAGTIASIATYKYSVDNRLLYFSDIYPSSGLSSSETIYTYKYSPARSKRRMHQDNHLLQITKLNISPDDSLKSISESQFYTYDQAGNMLSESRFSGGVLSEKSEFIYDSDNKLKNIKTYLEGGQTPVVLISLIYNKEGHISQDERKDLRT